MDAIRARRQALLALAALSLIWSYNWIVMKAVLSYIGPLDFSVLRSALGTALLFALLRVRREPLAPPPWRDTLLIGAAQTTGFQALVQLALVEGGAGKTALLAYTMPFWVVALAWPLLGERPSRSEWICVALAALGLVFVIEPWRPLGSVASCLLALAGGVCWALATVWSKRLFQRVPLSPLRLTAWQMLCGTFGMLVLAACATERTIQWSTPMLAALFYNAVFAAALAWALWLFVVKHLPAGIAGVASLATPLLGILLAWWLLGERPNATEALGIVLIAVALLGLLRMSGRARRAIVR